LILLAVAASAVVTRRSAGKLAEVVGPTEL
jgi:hypothetical protein